MIRVSGTMAYESEHFHDVCDELGLLVWQDLMFARMDYPWQDDVFRSAVAMEVTQALQDLHSRPSLAVICGNSEVDQQAAMLGLTPAQFSNARGDAFLADIVRAAAPHTLWVPDVPRRQFSAVSRRRRRQPLLRSRRLPAAVRRCAAERRPLCLRVPGVLECPRAGERAAHAPRTRRRRRNQQLERGSPRGPRR